MWSKKAAAVAGGAIFLTLAGLIRLNYLFISAGLVMLTFSLLVVLELLVLLLVLEFQTQFLQF